MGCHGFGVFGKAGSSWLDKVSEEHGLTENGKTVAPFSWISVPKETRQCSYSLLNSLRPCTFASLRQVLDLVPRFRKAAS